MPVNKSTWRYEQINKNSGEQYAQEIPAGK